MYFLAMPSQPADTLIGYGHYNSDNGTFSGQVSCQNYCGAAGIYYTWDADQTWACARSAGACGGPGYRIVMATNISVVNVSKIW